MALLNGELIDPFNGKKDLDDNLLRFVGDPMERIREDGLRVMRAIRFYITKGFDVEAHTWDSVNSDFAAEMLQKVSIERIHNELEKMFFFNTIKSIDAINCLNDRVKAAIFRESLHLIPSLKTKP
jgi:tRNA nucleotidyltransferase/poly(A) polymerase